MRNDMRRFARLTILVMGACLVGRMAEAQTGDNLTSSGFDAAIRIPAGLSIELFAGETQLKNPTALSLDARGRVFVAETHRWRKQIHDNRNVPLVDFAENHGEWLMDDLRCRTNDDRERMLERWSNGGRMRDIPGFDHFSADSELVRLLVDTDRDGKADQAEVFADGFNSPLSGTAGGIMVWDDAVYFANIPSIWKLTDEDGDGQADADRQLIQRGFGVRTSISGHDLNGFAIGPDRRLYWSVGDRGYHFKTSEGRTYEGVGKGAVFRSELDGAQVERFCDGLRNPKEVVFDDFGNLFTVDNNADLGDAARLYYLMEGGDYGWRMGHQVNAGQSAWVFQDRTWTPSVWMEEGLWELPFSGQPAYVRPPMSYITSGPCGFAANPGTVALPNSFDATFFIVDYRGAAARSGLFGFSLAADGAGFQMVDDRQVLSGVALTDIEFGYDGKLYMSDYIGGWGMTGKGRVLTLCDEDLADSWRLRRLQRLAREDFSEFGVRTLRKLIAHSDRRIRLRAQFALEDIADGEIALAEVAQDTDESIMKRLHALWGLGNCIRRDGRGRVASVAALLTDEAPLIRANAVRILAECDIDDAPLGVVRALLDDESPYVQSQAALAVGRMGDVGSVPFLLAILDRAGDEDHALRHAATYAVQQVSSLGELANLREHPSLYVRLAAVVGLRLKRSGKLASFLDDKNELVVREAARAIYDENVVDAYSNLAEKISVLSVIDDTDLRGYRGSSEITAEERELRLARQYHRRVLYANWHTGSMRAARALMDYASNQDMPDRLRLEALHCLETWGEPHELDRVVGDLRALPNRGTEGIYAELAPRLGQLISGASGPILAKAVGMAAAMGYQVPEKKLYAIMMDPAMESEARAKAMDSWLSLEPDNVEHVFGVLLADSDDWIFLKALEGMVTRRPELAADVIRLVAYSHHSSAHRRQKAVVRLEALLPEHRDPLVIEALNKLRNWELPELIQLEATTIAEALSDESNRVKVLLEEWKKEAESDILGEYAVTRAGGDFQKGKDIFENHAAAQCTRCHALYGRGGNAGPDLGGIGKDATVDYIVESIVAPGAQVADGWGIVTLELADGKMISGTLVGQDDDTGTMTVRVGEEDVVVLPDEVVKQTGPVSAMPPMGFMLSKEEIRDLVKFLSSQTQPLKKKQGH